MRARYIKTEFFDDSVLAGCQHAARLLFVALWQLSDRTGVFEWDVPRIRKYAFGYDNVTLQDVEKWMQDLLNIGRIARGTHEGKLFGKVVNLAKHQRFHRDEKARWQHLPSTTFAACQQPVGSLPNALILENLYLRTENGDKDPAPPLKTKKPKVAPESPSAPPGAGSEIRAAWFDAYQSNFGKKYSGWGAREAGQVTNLLKSWNAERIKELIPLFFRWRHQRVIDAGWPFGTGCDSFVMRIRELHEDTQNPERRKIAGAVRVQTRHEDRESYNEASGQEALKLLEAEDREREREAANRIEGAGTGTGIRQGAVPASAGNLGASSGAVRVGEIIGDLVASLAGKTHADAG